MISGTVCKGSVLILPGHGKEAICPGLSLFGRTDYWFHLLVSNWSVQSVCFRTRLAALFLSSGQAVSQDSSGSSRMPRCGTEPSQTASCPLHLCMWSPGRVSGQLPSDLGWGAGTGKLGSPLLPPPPPNPRFSVLLTARAGASGTGPCRP